MTPVRNKLAAAALSSAVIAGLFGGTALVRDTHAQDAAPAPAQGKVQAPVEVTAKEQEHLEGLASIFRRVGKAVEPSVVHIEVTKTVPLADVGGGGPGAMPYDEMLKRFFRDNDGDGEPDVPDGFAPGSRGNRRGAAPDADEGEEREFKQRGTGSGVIMEVNGSDVYVLTNNHVAGGASDLRITLYDGRVVEDGKVVGTDPKTDLAVVKLKADNVTAAPWGDSGKLEKGDWIMAFGSPFGFVGSMTHGIVSALNREARILGPNAYESFIQVDAPINPGNSGGPLVNTRGEVVGINTAIASRSGGFQGIGFAVPSNQAKFVYTALKNSGKVTRGFIGLGIQDAAIQPAVAHALGYEKREGVLVRESAPAGPAAGKLKKRDIITALDGKPVRNAQELRNTVASTAPGTDLKVTVFRKGKTEDVTVKIAQQPEDMTRAMSGGRRGEPVAIASAASENTGKVAGLTLVTPGERVAAEFGLGDLRQGALVTALEPKSAGEKAGLMKGDVITTVGDQEVQTAKQAADAIRKLHESGKDALLDVVNVQGPRFEVIKSQEK